MSHNGVKKYLSNGAISPLYMELELRDQQEQHELEFQRKQLEQQLQIQNKYNANNDITLEEAFKFLKAHSDTEEDLELAKTILRGKGIKV